MTKREYLSQPAVAERITSEAEGDVYWDAYAGSACLLRACWDLFEKRGAAMGVKPEVAGLMMERGVGKGEALAAFRP